MSPVVPERVDLDGWQEQIDLARRSGAGLVYGVTPDGLTKLVAELRVAREVVKAARYLLTPHPEPSWGNRIERLAEAISDYNDSADHAGAP